MSNLIKLKIKLKTLAAESRIIRQQELKMRGEHWGSKGTQYYFHRVAIVRPTTRENHLAYGFLKGKTYRQMEQYPKTMPNWPKVFKVVRQFAVGTVTEGGPIETKFNQWKKETAPIRIPPVHKPKKEYTQSTEQLETA